MRGPVPTDVLVGDIPYPLSTVGNDDFLFRPVPAPLPCLGVDPTPELSGGFNGAGIGCRPLVTNRPALGICGGLSEYATQLDLARARRLTRNATGAAFQFRSNHGYLGAIHFDVQFGYGEAHDLRQLKLPRSLGPGLFLLRNIGANGLGLPLDGLGRHLKSGEQFQLYSTALEAGFAAHYGHHATDPGGEFGAFNVQFGIARTLAGMTIRTQIIRTSHRERSQYRHQMFRPHLMKMRLLAAGAGQGSPELLRGTQQLFQHFRAEFVNCGADGHFQRFQIELPTLAKVVENDLQKRG